MTTAKRGRGRPRKYAAPTPAGEMFEAAKSRYRYKDHKELPRSLAGLVSLWTEERSPVADSIRSMEVVVRVFTEITGVVDPMDLNRSHLLAFKKEILQRRQLTAITFNTYLRHIKTLFRVAELWGFDYEAVFRDFRTVPVAGKKKKTISDLDIKRVLEYLNDPYGRVSQPWFWQMVIRTLYYTGMRRRQLVCLKWRDIDLQAGIIHLVAESSKTKRAWDIPLNETLVPLLAELQRRAELQQGRPARLDDQVFNVCLWGGGGRGWITKGERAQVMTVDHVSSAFKRLGKIVGVDISSHRFRHTFGTQLAKSDGSVEGIREIQHLMGHTNMSTTMEYIEPDVGKMRQMVGGLSGNI